MLTTVRGPAIALVLLLGSATLSHAQAQLGAPSPTAPTTVPPPATLALPVPAPAPPGTPDTPPIALSPNCGPGWHLDPLALYASVYADQGCAAGPAACAPYEDRNGPLLFGDPLLDNGPARPGWLAAVELATIVPRLQDNLSNSVTLANGTTHTVLLPYAPLGVREMPTLIFGYRLGESAGDITVSYRFVVADGTQYLNPGTFPTFAPTGVSERSRLNVQVLDIDYGQYEPSLGPQWDMKWRVGIRGIMNYSDNQADAGFVAQQTTNRFWGIGPHAALDLRRWLGDSGFALFGRLDVSVPIGRDAQRYIDVTALSAGESRFFENNQVLSLNGQAGVAWSPNRCDNFRITAGYTLEHWFDIGAIGAIPVTSRQQLNLQGGFLRAEWNY